MSEIQLANAVMALIDQHREEPFRSIEWLNDRLTALLRPGTPANDAAAVSAPLSPRPDLAGLVERLRREWPLTNKKRFGLVNPDGPEAADALQQLSQGGETPHQAAIEAAARECEEARKVIGATPGSSIGSALRYAADRIRALLPADPPAQPAPVGDVRLREADWVVAAARYTLHEGDTPPTVRNPLGKSIEHASWMLAQIIIGEVSGRKAHRWLGYAQGVLVAADWLTLEAAKLANKRASAEAALTPPTPEIIGTSDELRTRLERMGRGESPEKGGRMMKRLLPRALVRAEIKDILRTGRRRILELGGDCDPLDRMVHGAMHVLDKRAEAYHDQ